MKATKFVLIIAMLAFVSMSYADKKPGPTLTVKISLTKAIQNPGLVRAIYNQVSERTLLAQEQNGLYTAKVNYHRVVYVIYGKYEEWRNFFVMDPILLPLKVEFNGCSVHP
ncbi:MAG: hypothetical protein K8R86_01505 [Bacteroidales bacterium]|nr:hypothetical protein [Bacteroidales bacterium]